MSDNTHIEWTDATWNPITGCSVVSAGCKHCYAMKLAGTRLQHHPSRAGLTIDTKAGPVWTGEVRFNEEWLDQPLRWRRPRRIFVCAHGDLFHESVPDTWIDRVFDVMHQSPKHSFQVLTKRPKRMLAYLARFMPSPKWEGYITRDGVPVDESEQGSPIFFTDRWPLPNVWLGVSVEDQAAADERIPLLLKCQAAVHWISAEPLLGPISFDGMFASGDIRDGTNMLEMLDWVVAGGESGTGARPMHPEWARGLRDQCVAASVPFLFKQWGAWVTEDQSPIDITLPGTSHSYWAARDRYGEWTKGDLTAVYLVGKKAAGRQLDGILHDAYPVTP